MKKMATTVIALALTTMLISGCCSLKRGCKTKHKGKKCCSTTGKCSTKTQEACPSCGKVGCTSCKM